MEARYWRARVQAWGESVLSVLPDRELAEIAACFTGSTVLEIGGPSYFLAAHGRIPLYPRLAALDSVNYSETTLWDGAGFEGISPGRSVIGEARSLEMDDCAYDAVIASHVIEHLADPLGAMREWRRVIEPGGLLLLIVPHRDRTFDHRRPVTPIEHLLADAERRTPETDQTHVDEVLRLHDLRRDWGAGRPEEFRRRCRENARWRALHHHAFVPTTIASLCELAGFDIEWLGTRWPYHIICLATRPASGNAGTNN